MSAGGAGGIDFQIQARNQAQAALRTLTTQLEQAQRQGNLTAAQMAALAAQVARAGSSAARLDDIVRAMQRAGNAATAATGSRGGGGFLGMAGAVGAGMVAAQAFTGVLGGLSSAVTDNVQAAFQYNSTIQAQTVAFESLTGSAEEGARTVKDLVNFANTTPFDSKTVLDFGQKLLFAGQSAESLIPTMEAIGNISAASGKLTSENMSRVALALSQVATAGRLQGDELNQLADAGIPALQAVMQAYGLTREEAVKLKEQGGISSEMLISALRKMGLESEKFSGTMAGQMDQPLGALEALKSNLEAARADALKPLTDAMGEFVVGLAKFSQSKDFQGFIAGMSAALKELVTMFREGLAPALAGLANTGAIRDFTVGALQLLRNFIVGVDFVRMQVGNAVDFIGDQFGNVTTIIAAGMQVVGNSFATFGSAMDKLRSGDIAGAFKAIEEGGERSKTVFGILNGAVGAAKDRFGEYAEQTRTNAAEAAKHGQQLESAFVGAFNNVQNAAAKTSASVAGDLAKIGEPKVKPEAIQKFSDDLIAIAKQQAEAHADAAADIADIQLRLNEKLDQANAKRAEQIKGLLQQEKEAREALEDALAVLDEKRAGERAQYEASYNDLVIAYSAARTQEERDAITKQITAIQQREEAAKQAFAKQEGYGKQYAALISQLQAAQTLEQQEAIAEQIRQLERKELKEKDVYDKSFAQERQQTVNQQVQSAMRTQQANREADAAIDAANREAAERTKKVNDREANEIAKSADKRDKLIRDHQEIGRYVDIATGQINEQGTALLKGKKPADDLAAAVGATAPAATRSKDALVDMNKQLDAAVEKARDLEKAMGGVSVSGGGPPINASGGVGNVPYGPAFQSGGLTGGYSGPATVHPGEAILPLSEFQPMMNEAVAAALKQYFDFVRQYKDPDNDFITHLPEVMRSAVREVGRQMTAGQGAGTGGPSQPVPVAIVQSPGTAGSVVDYGPTETEASKNYRRVLAEAEEAAAKAMEKANKEAADEAERLAKAMEKAAEEAAKLAKSEYESGLKGVQKNLSEMSPLYLKNLQTVVDRFRSGQIGEEQASAAVKGIFGSFYDASGKTAAAKKAQRQALFEQQVAKLLGFKDPNATSGPVTAGGLVVNVPVTIPSGFVGTDQDIAKKLGPAIRDELVKLGITGTKIGGRI